MGLNYSDKILKCIFKIGAVPEQIKIESCGLHH